MSKAFTNEDTPLPDDAEALPPRERQLPITPAGLARLQKELAGLTAAGPSEVGARRARVLAQVLTSVYALEPSIIDGAVAFGTCVTVEDTSGERTSYEIVGPDEVEVTVVSVTLPASPAGEGTRRSP